MKFIETAYMPKQFAIFPAVGIIRTRYRNYRYRLSIIWGFWGISFGLGRPKDWGDDDDE